MKGKNLKVSFVDDERRTYPISQATTEEIGKAIKELADELVGRLGK